MGNIRALRRPGKPEACVVGDHVYMVLTRAELVNVVEALHLAGEVALEQRLAEILHQLPPTARTQAVPLGPCLKPHSVPLIAHNLRKRK
jgi:hypothetical protein